MPSFFVEGFLGSGAPPEAHHGAAYAIRADVNAFNHPHMAAGIVVEQQRAAVLQAPEADGFLVVVEDFGAEPAAIRFLAGEGQLDRARFLIDRGALEGRAAVKGAGLDLAGLGGLGGGGHGVPSFFDGLHFA